MPRFRLNHWETAYLEIRYPPDASEREAVAAVTARSPYLDYADRQLLADMLERRRWIERQAMLIAPPKHSATSLSERWAASFHYRLRFLDSFIRHLRVGGPAPAPDGQLMDRSVVDHAQVG